MKPIFSISVLILLVLTSCKQSGKDVATKFYKEGKFNGAVLLAKNDTVLCDTILGYRDFRRKEAFQRETPFYIASLAKPITAIGVMILQQKGSLNYEDKVGKYMKELPSYVQNVTIKQLLTHTSGIKDYEGILNDKNLTNAQVLGWLQTSPGLHFTPGSEYEYSNSGYIILGQIIEKVSGKPLKEFLYENIFQPIKMEHTWIVDESTAQIQPKAIGFNKNKQLDDYQQLTTGDGGIYSTVEDLYTLDKALRKSTLINKANNELMYQQPLLSNGDRGKYGFGWFVSGKNEKTVMHSGGLNGFRSLYWRDLKNGFTLIVLTNQGDAFPIDDFLNEMKKTMKE